MPTWITPAVKLCERGGAWALAVYLVLILVGDIKASQDETVKLLREIVASPVCVR